MNIETLKIKHSRDKRIFSLQNQGVKVLILAIYFQVFKLKICQNNFYISKKLLLDNFEQVLNKKQLIQKHRASYSQLKHLLLLPEKFLDVLFHFVMVLSELLIEII